ncbi:MAG TPA: hypothetical protein VLG12_08440 [Candidatus Saccharimonadales bacterium]|nr:hypothetical protein [Candidatus Saccharimonadales bacterium]
MQKIIVIILLTTYYLLRTTHDAHADTSQGDDYIFHMQINTDPDQQNLPYNQPGKYVIKRNQTITPTGKYVKPIAIPKVTPPPTTIQIGYTDNQPHSDFRFLLSDNIVDFGPLSPTDFITRESSIIVTGDPSYLYSVIAYENHSLQNTKNQSIPNTTCDDGNCTATIATDWTDTLTFGFGYHCESTEGEDCDKSFKDKDAYRKFSLNDGDQNGQSIMSGQITKEKKAKVLYKINVPGTQQQGSYQNAISYIAVPMY